MNLKFEIVNLKLARRGFTIVELLVAMSLLVVLLGLSGMVFNTTIAAHRAGGASIDVSRNLRAITEQLNADFRGLRKDAPLFVAFEQQWVDANGDGIQDIDELFYYDRIHFFADGDFQTMRQYQVTWDSNGSGNLDPGDITRPETIYGNLARIYYGQANSPAGVDLLSRKTHIMTSHAGALYFWNEIPPITNTTPTPNIIDYTPFDNGANAFGVLLGPSYTMENDAEFNTITLTDWINALNLLEPPPALPTPDNADHFIDNCMTNGSRPIIDLGDINTLHLLLSQGILQMRVQWAYTADDLVVPNLFTGVRWWPSVDPDGNGDLTDSDFTLMGLDQFGAFFAMPNGATTPGWFAVQGCGTAGGVAFKNIFYPKALKFTFVLRDSNGIFADGKTFTHIVYIDN
jgi:prepilin-type N-terminal cleavage/methylation domain-containing protein